MGRPTRGSLFTLPTLADWRLARPDGLGAKTHSDHARRNSLEKWTAPKVAQKPRKFWTLIGAEHAADKSILYENLQALRHAGGKLAPCLDLAQCFDTNRSIEQSRSEDICGRDRIL